MSSNDVKFSQSGNVGRCKDAKTITVTVTPAEGYEFEKWSDGSTANPRTFTMTSHFSYSVTCVANVTVRFYPYESASTPIKTIKVSRGSTASSVLPSIADTGIVGWTLDGWHPKGSAPDVNQPLTSDANYYAYWYKEFRNIIVRTDNTEPSNSSTATEEPTNKSQVYLTHLAWASELSLPAGATVSIAYSMGLLNHDGNATSHYLLMAPCMVSSDMSYQAQIDTRINETWSTIYKGVREWNASKQKWVYTNVKDEGVTLKIDTNASPTLKNDWGKYKPLQYYNEFHYFDDSMLYDENTGVLIPTGDWTMLTSNRIGHWSNDNELNPNPLNPKKHAFLSSTIATNKSVDNGLIQIDYDDYCVEDRTAYPIPATLGDGKPVNVLMFFLSKQTTGCTVNWRLLLHQIKFDLR